MTQNQAVFLSYASQDAEAARRLCDALRRAGMEVWFDQSELRGGDAWDASIRKQIKECTLFVPIISANTQARAEGYFRLEWRLADQRTHLMAKGMPFILPVSLDGTSEAGALVPDSFMDVQWTKLSDDKSLATFATRVDKLLAGSGFQAEKASNSAPGKEFAHRGGARDAALRTPSRQTGMKWVAIGSAVLGIGTALWFVLAKPAATVPRATSEHAASESTAPTAAINPLSVMVMPFANQTGDRDKAYIADALTSSITSDLSRIADASIVPAATAFSLRDRQLTVPQLGKEASVRFVLTGSVTGDRAKLRINAVLADTQTGAQLWTENFDGKATDLFALQDQVTQRIGNSIGPKMIITAARESEKRASAPQVADLLMRARALWLDQQSLQNHQTLEALYRQALALEPGNLQALSGLASTLALQAANFPNQLKLDDASRIALARKAFDLAQQVKARDPSDADAYLPIQLYFREVGDHDAAIQAAQRRVELQPKGPRAHGALCALKRAIDDIAGAKSACMKSVELATHGRPPAESYFNLAHMAFREGKLDEAIAWAQKGNDANPNASSGPVVKAVAYARKGDVAQARKFAADAMRLDPYLSMKNQFMFPKPWPGKEVAFKAFMESTFIPAWRLAGLPE